MDKAEKATLIEMERLKGSWASALELQRATNAFEHAVMKPAYLLNGGALIVVMTYLGAGKAMSEFEGAINFSTAVEALGAWVLGLVAAFLATFLGHESQLAFYKAHGHRMTATRLRDDGKTESVDEHDRDAERLVDVAKRCRGGWRVSVIVSALLFLLGGSVALKSLGGS